MISIATEAISLLASDTMKRNSRATDRFQKKDVQRPLCFHCGYKGHTVDRCYKLHGFPPGYRSNYQSNSQRVTNEKNSQAIAGTSGVTKESQSAFFSSLNTDQYSQLMNLLHTHLPSGQN